MATAMPAVNSTVSVRSRWFGGSSGTWGNFMLNERRMRLTCARLASMRFPCAFLFVPPWQKPDHSRLGRLAAGLPCRRWFGAALRASRILSTRVCVFC